MEVAIERKGYTTIEGGFIPVYRLIVLLQGIKLELKGMKLSKGASCYSIIKKEIGLRGSMQSVHDQFEQIVEDTKREVLGE